MPGFELFGEAERKEVNQVLETGILMRYGFDDARGGNWKARELESELSARMQTRHAHLVSSGTAALTVAMASAGIGAGDEVIIPAFTFVASFEAVLSLGAIPVLVNIDNTLTLDPQAVEAAITPKTKAVMPVHMCGSMADLEELKRICNEHDLKLVEDACQAIGGTFDGVPLGAYGDVGCFSFDFVKTITCGEGGALITNNPIIYENAHKYSDHGHDHLGKDRGAEEHPFLGYNYRISELHAAVGLAQLQRLDEFLEIQRRNYTVLRKAVAVFPEVEFRHVPEKGTENYSFLNFFLPDEAAARKVHKALGEAGIDGCFYWYDNNWHYHKKWDHLKMGKGLGPFSPKIEAGIKRQHSYDFSKSDHWMGRNISCLIKLGWTAEEVKSRALTMQKVLSQFFDS